MASSIYAIRIANGHQKGMLRLYPLSGKPIPSELRDGMLMPAETTDFDPTTVLFSLGLSSNKMPAVILKHPAPETRLFIRSVLSENKIVEPSYIVRSMAGASLEKDHADFVLVEFWNREFLPFIEYLNEHFSAWYRQSKRGGFLKCALERQANS